MGGKVLVPTQEAVQKLTAARLAADTMGVPTIILARTDANAAAAAALDLKIMIKILLLTNVVLKVFM